MVRPRHETNEPRQQEHRALQSRVGLGQRYRPRRQQPHADDEQSDGGEDHPPVLPDLGVAETRPVYIVLAGVVVAVLDERVAVSRSVVRQLVPPESATFGQEPEVGAGDSPAIVDADVHLRRAGAGRPGGRGAVYLDGLVRFLLESVVDGETLGLSVV